MAGEVKVFSSALETGESEESVPSEYTGPDLEIGFNAQYLLDFLRAVPQSHVSFGLKDQKSAGELQPGGDDVQEQYQVCRHADADLNVRRSIGSVKRLRNNFLWQMKV